MSDPSTPPPLPPAAKSNAGPWWLCWIICTVVLPGSAVGLSNVLPGFAGSEAICAVIGIAALILHIVSSIKLSGSSAWLSFGLIFGGWFLMLASFFVGCLMTINLGR